MTRVAIVEDNQVIRESLAAYVRMAPELQCVCACATAEQAIETLPGHQPEVVLMDIQLPGQSGIECTARLKQLLPDVRIIMVTVYGDPEVIFKALRAGACGYLLKRCTPEELITAVREVRQGAPPCRARSPARSSPIFNTSPTHPTPRPRSRTSRRANARFSNY
jgi:DNA-binding NarL/FixJ family response regulator